MRHPRVLAVDIGAGHVACGVFSTGATGRLVLQQFAFEPLSSDPAHDARLGSDLTRTLGALAVRLKPAGAASLAVPGHLALTKFVKTPSVPREKRSKILAFEAAENIPYALDEVVWDHLVVSDDGFDLEVIFVAAKFEAVQSLCAAADAAGFAVGRAIPSGVALHHAFQQAHPRLEGSVVVANVGARSTQLLFLEGGRFYLRTLPFAGNAMTQAIAEELGVPFASAETLKVQVLSGRSDLPANSPARTAVQRAAAQFAAKLGVELIRATINHRRQSGAGEPDALYLTGGGAQLAELPAILAAKTKWRVERFDPLRHVDVAADARAAGADAAAPALADLVGLATRLVAKHEPEASLLPPAIAATIAFRKRQPALLAAAALAVAAFLPPWFYLQQRAEATRAQLAQVEEQLRPVRVLQARNEENLRLIEDAKRRVAALRAAHASRSNWVGFFSDLQNRLVKVEDVWLDRLQIVRSSPADEQPPAASDATPAAEAGAPAPAPMRLTLSGRLLDVANPQSRVSRESLQRVKALLASFVDSQFVAAVENEQFDNRQNGMLRFDCTLVLDPAMPL